MLTYSIKVKGAVEETPPSSNVLLLPRTPVVQQNHPRFWNRDMPPLSWDKQRFSKHLEMMRELFKKGDRVAFATMPEVTAGGRLGVIYRIEYIEEIFTLVKWDHDLMVPQLFSLRALNIQDKPSDSIFPIAAKRIRHLSAEEAKLADLLDTPVQGTA